MPLATAKLRVLPFNSTLADFIASSPRTGLNSTGSSSLPVMK